MGNWPDGILRDDATNRHSRYQLAGRVLGEARIRNRCTSDGGHGCPILIEGKRDRLALQKMGFTGEIEQVYRGWDQPRLVAYLFEKYGRKNPVDQGPVIIVLMDWDRTGGRLQRNICDRLEAFGATIDEKTRMELARAMKPEGRTVESMKSHAHLLRPYIDAIDPDGIDKDSL
ncbi:MAG: hypothetical protein VX627_04495 [Candidatus Thermoplasmatota archaeon]|nr:hypothetical protein [Candidatus Thermoplasmatota archaeon]